MTEVERDDHIFEAENQQMEWGVERREGLDGLVAIHVVGRMWTWSPF